MTPYQSALAVFLGTATAALPSAAQYVSPPPILASQACAGCFAYLEFAPPLEPEPYAMRGQATKTSIALPAAALTGIDLSICPRCGQAAMARRPLPSCVVASSAAPPDTS